MSLVADDTCIGTSSEVIVIGEELRSLVADNTYAQMRYWHPQ